MVTSTQIIPPEITAITTTTKTLLSELFKLEKITSDPELEYASIALTKIRTYLKQSEEVRTSLVKPLNDHVSFINSRFHEITKPIEDENARISSLMTQYRKRLEDDRIAKQKILDEEAAKNVSTSPIPEAVSVIIPPAPKTIQSVMGKTTFRTVWKWKVVDLTKIPHQYLIPDDATINRAVRAGIHDIPGIEVYKEEVPSVKAG